MRDALNEKIVREGDDAWIKRSKLSTIWEIY